MSGTSFPTTDFAASAAGIVAGLCFVGLLAATAVSDVRARRIPNRLVVALAIVGLLYSATLFAPATGLARALLGGALGFALWIPFYGLGMLGAGDVKLFAAAGFWLAPSQLFAAALVTALVGGVLSIAGLVLAHGAGVTSLRMAQAMRDPSVLSRPLPVPAGRRTLPYGLAMAVGLALAGWLPRMLQP